MEKLTIIVDLDEIVADLLHPWLDLYNEEYNDNLTIDKINKWNIEKFVKPECKNIKKYLNTHIFRDLKPLPGAIKNINRMHKEGHKIVFATRAYGKIAYQDKLEWLYNHFPFLESGENNVFFGPDKFLLNGDVFIDDSPDNLNKYMLHHKDAVCFTISYPYNKDSKVRPFGSYTNTLDAWNKMADYIIKCGRI